MTAFADGERVELHPATDRWMMGDRFGRVVRTRLHKPSGRMLVHVKLEVSGKTLKFLPEDVLPLSGPGRMP